MRRACWEEEGERGGGQEKGWRKKRRGAGVDAAWRNLGPRHVQGEAECEALTHDSQEGKVDTKTEKE